MSNATAAYGAKVAISTDGTTYNDIGEVRNVRVQVAGENIDVTSFDTSGWRDRIIGLSDWTFSAGSFYLEADTAQDNLWSAITGRTSVYLRLRPKGNSSGADEYIGQCQITAYSIEGAVDDAFATELEGVGMGAITKSTQT
jgi:predicted secreted protein